MPTENRSNDRPDPSVPSSPAIDRIEWLDIRAVWKNEAVDFTPWLLENVDVLRDALDGLEIELERTEHPVGPFSLDLIGSDLTHNTKLIVENQIERSDHRHLGQLLTYAAGSDAGTVIWIAKRFEEPHRVALDWLNQHTDEETRFFGVVIKALRVGSSPAAPLLEVVAKPSDWQKSVRRTTARESADNLAYRSFWKPLRERLLRETPEVIQGRAESRSLWLSTNSPITGTTIAGEIGAAELRVVLEIDTGDRERNLALLAQAQHHRVLLESEVGELDFIEGKVRSKIVRRLSWDGKLLTQPDRHDEARAWFYQNLRGLRRGVEAVANGVAGSGQ